jgi:ABC-2 type transport system ATP-binding protein
MACIEAHGLSKAFGTTVALDGIDLRVEEGRILGLIGPNGAGKSTALNTMLGLIPYQGRLSVLGRDPWRELTMRSCATSASSPTWPCCRAGCASPMRSTTQRAHRALWRRTLRRLRQC